MIGRLLVVDALAMRFSEIAVERDPSCTWCGTRTSRALLSDYAAFCGETPAEPTSDTAGTDDVIAISPTTLAMRLARGDRLRVLDVREPWEHAVAHLEGTELIPMQSIPARQATLERGDEFVVLCHHGTRSAMVADYLRAAGLPRVLNLEGGIDRWSVEVDPSVPRY
jgi:adenylyltransferase/sulfurtransferase